MSKKTLQKLEKFEINKLPNFIESIFSHIDYNKTICNEKHRLAYNYYYKKVNNFNLIQLY